jgi:MFS family permease
MLSVFKNLTVWVVALGYFVDIFDITLFGMLRVQSLKDLGFEGDELLTKGQLLLNAQMFGMLLGGFIFGVLGDKKGRLVSLFASIILYSLGNLANAFVQDINSYVLCRIISGIGLAGELGLGVTLVVEILHKDVRGMGTAFIATIGVLGAVVAGVLVEMLSWRTCYIVGGSMGLLLLFLRISVKESGMFHALKNQSEVSKGSIRLLFSSKDKIQRYILCILVGMPIWYVAGIVMTLSPELGVVLGVTEPILASRSIAISYLGLALGDFLSGVLSQYFKSRKKVLIGFELFTMLSLIALFVLSPNKSANYYYVICFIVGIGAGFWALFVTVCSEQFGTNLRATVTTTVPNLVRGSLILMNLYLTFLRNHMSFFQATLVTGVTVFAMCIISTLLLRETFSKDLDYTE